MLIPTKHDHPDLTILATSAVVLSLLRQKRSSSYEEVREALEQTHPQAPLMLPLATTFLFALGLIEYAPATDAFIFRGEQ